MAQPVFVAPSTSKLRIKLKGVTKQHGSSIVKGAAKAPSFQLQELQSAVEAFCRQGINSLPGAVLLPPWREELVDQQWSIFTPVAESQQQLVTGQRRRVRKRRAAAAIEQDARDISWPLLQWSRARRRRSSAPARVPRAAVQLCSSMCFMQGKAPQPIARPAPSASAAALQQQPQQPSLLQRAAVPQQPQPQAQPKQQQQPAVSLKRHAKAQQAVKQQQQSLVKNGVQPAAKGKSLQLQQQPRDAQQVQQTARQASEPQAAKALEQREVSAKQASEQRVSKALEEQQQQQQPQQQSQQEAKPVQKQPAVAPSIPNAKAEPAPSKLRLKGQAANSSGQQQQQEPHQEQEPQLQQVGKKQKQATQPEAAQPGKQQRSSLQVASPGAAAKAAADASSSGSKPSTAGPVDTLQPVAPALAPPAPAAADGPAAVDASQLPGAASMPDSAAKIGAAKAAEAKAAEAKAAAEAVKEESSQAAAAASPEPARAESKLAPAVAAKPTPAAEEPVNAASPPAAAGVKPESPPSETSHQQPIGAAVSQHIQQLQQPLPPQLPQEQTVVSRDRSQCSLQQPAEPASAAASGANAAVAHVASAAASGSALSTPAVTAAVPAAATAARAPKQHLLELAPAAMTPAARALADLRVPEVQFKSLPPAGRPVRNQDEALEYVRSLMAAARAKKHFGDERAHKKGHDVLVLNYYAMSTLMFLQYIDTAQKLARQLAIARQPMEKLQHHINQQLGGGFLKQVSGLCSAALQMASNCKGPDVVKQALRMLLERLGAICQMRHLHSQREALLTHVRLLKSSGSVSSSSTVASSSQQHVQRASSGKPPSHGSSPHGQQAFNKRSPDDSNTSNQDRVQLPGMGQPDHHSPGRLQGVSPAGAAAAVGALGVGAAGGGSGLAVPHEHDLQCAKAEAALVDCMNELLRVTDGMHQTVMRMQQFLESPEVLASEQARTAALHISTLGLDAGMFSIPRVVAHSEAALASLLQYTRLMKWRFD